MSMYTRDGCPVTRDIRMIHGGAGQGGAPYDSEIRPPLSLKQQAVQYRNKADVLAHTGQHKLALLFRSMANAIDPIAKKKTS
ncbi:MAG: hypothetical protein V4449_01640 [Patescibacteria group bacterium]